MSEDIKYKFKADLNGWLEHEKKYSHGRDPGKTEESFKNLVETFSKTLEYYNNSTTAFESLHDVLFQALVKRKDYETDFDVPPFENGVNHELFYRISKQFNLFRFTCYALWAMPGKEAIGFIMATSQYAKEPLRAYHATFIKLIHVHKIKNEDILYWLDKQLYFNEEIEQHVHNLTQLIHDCLNDNKGAENDLSDRDKLLDMLKILPRLVEKTEEDLTIQFKTICHVSDLNISNHWLPQYVEKLSRPNSFGIKWKTRKDERETHYDLRNAWEQTLLKSDILNRREKTFMVICEQLQNQSFTSHQVHPVDPGELIAIQEMENKICKALQSYENRCDSAEEQDMIKNYKQCLLWCCFVLKNRGMFWKSVVKIMVQFVDLWMPFIQESRYQKFFTGLIANENLLVELYDHLMMQLKIHRSRDSIIPWLFLLLEQSMERAEKIKTILGFRDYIFEKRDVYADPKLPFAGTTQYWSCPFESSLTRIANQITLFSEDDEDAINNIVKNLAILSVMWPYKVVHTLFLACAQNPRHYQAITPIFHKLGKLCRLEAKYSHQDPLLIMAMKDYISELKDQDLDSCEKNILQFISHCLYQEVGHDYPLLLMSNSQAHRFFKILSFKDFIVRFVNFYLRKSDCKGTTLALLSLALFDDARLWQDGTYSSHPDPPVILDLFGETELLSLTSILDISSTQPEKVKKAAYTISRIVCQLASHNGTYDHIDDIREWIRDTSSWWHKALWVKLVNKTDFIDLPEEVYAIIGNSSEVFCNNGASTSEPWKEIFFACQISTDFTDVLFKNVARWGQHLAPFYKHPRNNRLLLKMEQSLYPLGTSFHYNNLLNYFLSTLYDALDLEDNVKSYSNEPEELSKYVSFLTNTATKSYFIVLNAFELLMPEPGEPSVHCLNQLVKIIQGVTNWSEISIGGHVNAYRQLSNRVTRTLGYDESLEESCVYYPLLETEETRSNRALSVLVLYHLFLVSARYTSQEVANPFKLLMPQVLEGLIDKKSREQFLKMLQTQPRNRKKAWKKRSHRVYLKMRPVLTENELKLFSSIPNIEMSTEYEKFLTLLRSYDIEGELYLIM